MLTIKAAAAHIGIPEATLRAWERRYAVVSPVRTPAGYRLYDESTLSVLREMNRLVTAGWAPSQAAVEVLRHRSTSEHDADDTQGSVPGPQEWAEQLVIAAGRMDGRVVSTLLDEVFARVALEPAIEDWLMPGLRAMGDAWGAGEVSIAGEHLVSHAVLRRLSAVYETIGNTGSRPKVVVGLPAGARHELGALAFAVLVRRAGADVLYLGPDLLAEEWPDALTRHEATVAVVAVPTRPDAGTAKQVVDAVARECPQVQVWLGGAGASALGMPHLVVSSELVRTAREIAR